MNAKKSSLKHAPKPALRLAYALCLISSLCLTAVFLASSAVAQPAARTVQVDCNRGESINRALERFAQAGSLTVEIRGLCRENVVVTRDRVTLRGADPATDGIQAVANTEQTDAALWVRGAQLVTIENLKLTGGFTGLLATDANLPHLRLLNCRLEGNVQWGALLELALIVAEDTTFGPNTRFSVGVFAGSRFECRNCALTLSPATDVRDNLVVFTASQALLINTTLVNGGISVNNSQVALTDSSMQAFAAPGVGAVIAGGSSVVNLIRTQVEGPMRFSSGTTAGLFGVTQTPGATPGPTPNVAEDAAFVKIGNASPAVPGPPPLPSVVLGFNLNNFSNASLLQTSQVNGNLNCSLGANAVCVTPANVSGASNCGLCPKP